MNGFFRWAIRWIQITTTIVISNRMRACQRQSIMTKVWAMYAAAVEVEEEKATKAVIIAWCLIIITRADEKIQRANRKSNRVELFKAWKESHQRLRQIWRIPVKLYQFRREWLYYSSNETNESFSARSLRSLWFICKANKMAESQPFFCRYLT
jgi:hypothetical protein